MSCWSGSILRTALVLALLAALVGCDVEDQAEDAPEPSPEATSPLETDGHEPVEEAPRVEVSEPDELLEPGPVDAHGVSAGHPLAVAVGMEILEEGGTAVDAAVAVAYTLGVVEPFASGVGGGGATLVVTHDGQASAYDYREVVAQNGVVPDTGSGVPGFVAGMERLRDDHGVLELERLLTPAIELAQGGFEVGPLLADMIATAQHRLPVSALPDLYPDGAALEAGDRLNQPELGMTLRRLLDEGPDSFYRGALAAELSDAVPEIDGASLEAYEVVSSEPPAARFGEHEVLTAAPPLPGVSLLQALQVAEALEIADLAPESADYVHRIASAWRVAHATLAWELGDPAFVEVPVDELIDPERNASIAASLPTDRVVDLDHSQPRGGIDPNTTHVTVVDADGTLVSMTNTLTNFWGSGQHALGFFVNDQLSRFVIGASDTNDPEPGKRSVSWTLPAAVVDDQGRPVLGLGTPGGSRIPTGLMQILIGWELHSLPLEEVVTRERFHVEGVEILVERMPDQSVSEPLRMMGYQGPRVPDPVYYFGSIQALEIDHDTGRLVGATDPRREGDWDASDR